MSVAAATKIRPPGVRERRELPGRRAVRLFDPGQATLDDRITATWQRLVEAGSADCPVCGDLMQAGRACGCCGSELT